MWSEVKMLQSKSLLAEFPAETSLLPLWNAVYTRLIQTGVQPANPALVALCAEEKVPRVKELALSQKNAHDCGKNILWLKKDTAHIRFTR